MVTTLRGAFLRVLSLPDGSATISSSGSSTSAGAESVRGGALTALPGRDVGLVGLAGLAGLAPTGMLGALGDLASVGFAKGGGTLVESTVGLVGWTETSASRPWGGGDSGSGCAVAAKTNQSGMARLGTTFLLPGYSCKRLAIGWLAIEGFAQPIQGLGKREAFARFLTQEGVEIADAAKSGVDAWVGTADVGSDLDQVGGGEVSGHGQAAAEHDVTVKCRARGIDHRIGQVVTLGQHGVHGGDAALAFGVAGALDQSGQHGEHRRGIAARGGRLASGKTDFSLG